MRLGRYLALALLLGCMVGCPSRPTRDPSLYSPDASARADWVRAIGLLENGEAAPAIEPMRAVIQRSPRFVRAHLLYQDAMIAVGRDDDVEAEYGKAREASGLALALYARVTTRGTRVALLEDAVEKEPDCPWIHYFLGRERLRLLELDPARARLKRALELDPDLAGAWMALAMLRVRRYDPEGAAEATRRYLEKCPLDAIHWFKLGHYLQSTGDTEEAVKAYRAATRISPAEMTAAIRRRDVLITDEQRRRFERPWSIGYQARINLADIWIEDRQLPRAIALLEKAVDREPDRPEAHYTLGIAHEKLGLAEARRRDPASRARAASHLERAGHHWRRYLELGGGKEERVRGWLEKLRQHDPDPFGGESD